MLAPTQDFVLNGQGHGQFGGTLNDLGFDNGLLRPYRNENGKKVCAVLNGKYSKDPNTGALKPQREVVLVKDLIDAGYESPAFNSYSYTKDAWVQLDTAVVRATRKRLRAWADLAAANTYGGFDGFGKTILEHQVMSDPGEALMNMDGVADGRTDAPKFELRGLPLPITYSDFSFSARRLATMRNTGAPLDTVMAEAAGRRVAEKLEKLLIGSVTGPTFGDSSEYDSNVSKIYGYTNFPDRLVKSDMTAPTGSNGPTILGDWLALREELYNANFFGPYMVYVSGDWDLYLDNLFSTTEPSAGTLRSRLLQVEDFIGIRRLDYLSGGNVPGTFTVVMVQMDPDVVRAVVGMPLSVVMWDSGSGFRKNFRVWTIQVPQMFSDINGNCGIAHGYKA